MPELDPMQITIDLRAVIGGGDEFEEFTLRDAVIQAAANKIVDNMDSEIREKVRERISRVDEIAHDEIVATVRHALARPIERRTAWGEKKGETTTVLEIAREHLEAFFAKPQKRDPYTGRTEGPVNLTGLIEEIITAAVKDQFSDAIKAARTAVDQRVRDVLTQQIGAALAKKPGY